MADGFEQLVRDWYIAEHPEDDFGYELNDDVSFEDAYEWLAENGGENGGGFYDFIGAADSYIREEIFGQLSELMECDYDVVYYQWLNGNNEEFLAFAE